MAVKNQKALIKKLKKQVRILKRKEEQSRNKLRAALKKAKKVGKTYKSKLARKMRMMKGKLAEAQAAGYAKVATDVERQMLKGIEAKAKVLKSAISKAEKKHIAKLRKSIAMKGKKVGGKRKVAPAKSMKKSRKHSRK